MICVVAKIGGWAHISRFCEMWLGCILPTMPNGPVRQMDTEHSLRFHWSACASDEPVAFLPICRDAERLGLESVHIPIATPLPDALALAVSAGRETERIRFRVGCDFNRILASLTGRELKIATEALGSRLIIHMAFDVEDSARNASFLSAGEFIANCRKLFPNGQAPQFDVEGEAPEAAFLAIKHADCLWRWAQSPNQAYADALPVLHFGKNAGLITLVIARQTRAQALESAVGFLPEINIEPASNPAFEVTPDLQANIISTGGAKAAIVGSCEGVARTIHGFKKHGILHFLLRDRPGYQDIAGFGERVLPLIRAIESGRGTE
jgi:alkanesulfonate monooxygenase SsuD/methylene tetrahydromethanopterin reductase-like flavin-dependent oxidoreductase (luciferase family)